MFEEESVKTSFISNEMNLSGDEAEEVPSGLESDPEAESEGEGDDLGEDEYEYQFNEFVRKSKTQSHRFLLVR